MAWTPSQGRENAQRLPAFLTPLVADLGHSERRAGATLYVEGLFLPGRRKSIEPMAQRLGVDSQKLPQFITDSPWEERTVWAAIGREVVDSLEPLVAWIVDETGWRRQGRHSVGVAHQYRGAAGKSANCQVNVQVAVTDGQVAVPVGARPYLPESWCEERARCRAAGIPEAVSFATQPEIALELIARVVAAGTVTAPVLADSAYGNSGGFQAGLRALNLEFFLQIDPRQLRGWTQAVAVEKKRTRWQIREGEPAARPLAELFAHAGPGTGIDAPGRPPTGKPAPPVWPGGESICRRRWTGARIIWRNSGWWWTGPTDKPKPTTTIWRISSASRPARAASG